MRTCNKCGLTKSLEEFHRDSRGPQGRSKRCADCANKHVQRYKEAHKDLDRYKRMEKAALLRDIRDVKESLGVRPERTDRDRLYSVFNQMKQRCYNPNNEKFPRYGGRGVTVEFADFKQFYTWSVENGYRQGLQIDRIDNDGPYHPDNCRWVERKTNTRNRQVTATLTAFGETKSVADWVEDPRCAVNYTTLVQRVRKSDWSPEEMVTLGPQPNQSGRLTKGQKEFCPQGHPYSEFRKWNKRGDYYCTECSRIRNRKNSGSRGGDAHV